MKASEFIKRIEELREVVGGDPEVVIRIMGYRDRIFASAGAEVQLVCKTGSRHWQTFDKSNDTQVIKVY